jgi:hypothetical protein
MTAIGFLQIEDAVRSVERRSELELDQERRRPFRWPYRLRPDLPLWVRRTLRQIPFWALVAVGYFTYRVLR